MAYELKLKLIGVDEHFGGKDQVGFEQSAGLIAGDGKGGGSGVRGAGLAVHALAVHGRLRSDGQGGDHGAVERDLEVAEGGDQGGREVVAEVDLGGLDDLGLRDGEVDGVEGVDAAHDDGVGDIDVGEGEGGVEGAGSAVTFCTGGEAGGIERWTPEVNAIGLLRLDWPSELGPVTWARAAVAGGEAERGGGGRCW